MTDPVTALPPSQHLPLNPTGSIDPLLDCLSCGETFRWSSSCDDDRCGWCAGLHAAYRGES